MDLYQARFRTKKRKAGGPVAKIQKDGSTCLNFPLDQKNDTRFCRTDLKFKIRLLTCDTLTTFTKHS